MPSKKKRVNLTLDSRLYSLTSEIAELYHMPVSTFITHLLASAANDFPHIIQLLSKKSLLDQATAIEVLRLMPSFHLELGNSKGGAASTYPHTLAADCAPQAGEDPRASNTRVVLDNCTKIVH